MSPGYPGGGEGPLLQGRTSGVSRGSREPWVPRGAREVGVGQGREGGEGGREAGSSQAMRFLLKLIRNSVF